MVKVVSKAEAEDADFVVCMRVGGGGEERFSDNVYGHCAVCHHPIFYRPYNPQRPPKVCMQCAVALVEAQPKGDK
jgi:hypothetical protein